MAVLLGEVRVLWERCLLGHSNCLVIVVENLFEAEVLEVFKVLATILKVLKKLNVVFKFNYFNIDGQLLNLVGKVLKLLRKDLKLFEIVDQP